METIKRNKSREMKSATRTATLKRTVYEGDDIRFRISDSYRFFFSLSLSFARCQESAYKIRQRAPSKELIAPRTRWRGRWKLRIAMGEFTRCREILINRQGRLYEDAGRSNSTGRESNAYWTRCKITSCGSVGPTSVEIVPRDAFYDPLSTSGVVYPLRSPRDRAAGSPRKQQKSAPGGLIYSRDWLENEPPLCAF